MQPRFPHPVGVGAPPAAPWRDPRPPPRRHRSAPWRRAYQSRQRRRQATRARARRASAARSLDGVPTHSNGFRPAARRRGRREWGRLSAPTRKSPPNTRAQAAVVELRGEHQLHEDALRAATAPARRSARGRWRKLLLHEVKLSKYSGWRANAAAIRSSRSGRRRLKIGGRLAERRAHQSWKACSNPRLLLHWWLTAMPFQSSVPVVGAALVGATTAA